MLNDDNDGRQATGAPGDVADGQAMPAARHRRPGRRRRHLVRHPPRPGRHTLDVFGTVSTDGGKTFSPNFRVTDQSFDPNAGHFTDAEGNTDFYLGDRIGLALANGTAYAVWTDTRNGNQDVYFASYPINPPRRRPTTASSPTTRPPPRPTSAGWSRADLPKLAIARRRRGLVPAPGGGHGQPDRHRDPGRGPVTACAWSCTTPAATTLLATGLRCANAGGQVVGQSSPSPVNPARPTWCASCPGPRPRPARRRSTRWTCNP